MTDVGKLYEQGAAEPMDPSVDFPFWFPQNGICPACAFRMVPPLLTHSEKVRTAWSTTACPHCGRSFVE